jgi:hypothetical protein
VTWWRRGLASVVLGLWLGSFALFAFVVAPTAFRVLSSANVAGSLVGPVLDALQFYGMGAGLLLSALAASERRGALHIGLPLVLALLCAASQFGVTAAIDSIRPEAFGPSATAEAAAEFARLHSLSRWLYAATGLGLLVLCWAQARPDPTPRA